MVIRHGGLTAEERVKKAAEVCKQECSPYCPYWTEDECHKHMMEDCVEAIAERDERIAIMQESMDALEKRCNALEALEKRNEPIKPDLIMTTSAGIPMAHCPNCNEQINQYRHPKFCGACGQAVKWE